MADYHGGGRRAVGIVAAAACVWLAGLFAPAAAADRPTASGWMFTDVVRVGQEGFEQFDGGRAGPAGELVFGGYRNGRWGVYRMQDGALTNLSTSHGGADEFAVLLNGDVLFYRFDGNPSQEHLYRWSDRPISVTLVTTRPTVGSYPVASYYGELLQVTSDDRWLSAVNSVTSYGVYPHRWAFGLTDGVTDTTIVPLIVSDPTEYGCPLDGQTPAPTQRIRLELIAAAADVIAYGLESRPLGCDRIVDWAIELVDLSGGTQRVGSGRYDGTFGVDAGTRLHGLGYSATALFVNDLRQVAVVRWEHQGAPYRDVYEVVVFENGTERIMAATSAGTWQRFDIRDFDQQGRVLYVALNAASENTIFVDDERVIGVGDMLFGQKVTYVDARLRAAAPGPNEKQRFAFEYVLADGSAGFAIASREPRWKNASGGAWGAAANWDSGAVPGADANVEFDLDTTYGVDLGAHTASEAWVRRGDVEFRSGSLTLTGTTNSHLEVSGPLTDPAKLTISGVGTQVTATVLVGFNGSGELDVQDAIVWHNPGAAQGLDASMGFGGPATVTVSGAGAGWMWDQLELGVNEPSLLRVKDGALVGFIANRAIIGGSALAFLLKNETARLEVDDGSNTGMTMFGLVHELVIGEGLIGEVSVLRGGKVSAITTTLGTRDHGAATDGWLTVDGLSTQRPSTFESVGYEGGGLYASTGAGTDSVIQVSGGGVMTVGKLTLAQAAGSSAYMSIDGTAAGRRSTAAATDLVTDTVEGGECVVGERGRATLQVTNGALLRCRRLQVGVYSGSRGAVEVDGFEGDFAEIAVADPEGDAVLGPAAGYGAICIGAAVLCDFSISVPRANVQGDMLVGADAYVTARVVVVGSGGQLRGNGIVSTDEGVIVTNGGRVAPGVVQLTNPRGVRALTETVGTLTIRGDLTVSETGVITLDVLGASAGLQDRLVVTGAVDLRGRTVVNFGNGYAPKAGDVLQLIQAGGMSEAGASVEVAGLADGFQYDVSAGGGGLVLTAVNDGVAAGGMVYVPLVER